jgi:hypothetical protein
MLFPVYFKKPRARIVPLIGIILVVVFSSVPAAVSLTQGTVTYNHGAVNLNPDHTLGGGGGSIPTTFNALIIENEYVRIKLVPSYGSRIVSMLYKPTGHEELWTHGNAGTMAMDAFYFNWLMVWGGIFPTFGGPEHGKYWFLPWDYSIVKQNADTVSVAMSMTDSIPWRSGYSGKHSAYGASGIRCTFTVTLVSGATGFGVDVALVNPGAASVGTEYWTCTTISPGCAPGNLRLTDGAEMIMPDDTIKIHPDYNGLKGQEKQVTGDWYILNKLRWWKNWVEQGILYAQPKNSFWGVINHDAANAEGIMRICDNKVSYSCKIWTCGHGGLPYWEPWGGISDEFYKKATFAAGETKAWHEFYTPTLGMDSVTDATDDALVSLKTPKSSYNGSTDDSVRVTAQLFCTRPARQVHVVLALEGGGVSQNVYDATVAPDSVKGNSIKTAIACKQVYNSATSLTINVSDAQGKKLLGGARPLAFTNCATTGVIPGTVLGLFAGIHGNPVALYTMDGRLIGGCATIAQVGTMARGQGAYLVRYRDGTTKKILRVTAR